MATKTWKLGEICQGGVITTETTAKTVIIIAKEWDTSQGYNRGSNQSKAKEFRRLTVNVDDEQAYRKLEQYISELATSYWAEKILEWVMSKSKLEKKFFW